MNLPIIEILNQNLITDLKALNKQIKSNEKNRTNPKLNLDNLIAELSDKDIIVNNFKKINEYLNANKEDFSKASKERQFLLQGLTLQSNTYVDINNMFAKMMQEYKNITLNQIIKNIVDERYQNVLDIFKKRKYQNIYSKQITSLIEEILKTTDIKQLNEVEIEISNLIPNFVQKAVKLTSFEPEDDYKLASFAFGTRVTGKLFRELFNIAQKNSQNSTQMPKDTPPAQPKGKVITKEVPKDGPPKDYKSLNKII